MPEGVAVEVDGDGVATLDFVDRSKRGPALAALLKVGGPQHIEKLTSSGTRAFVYRVPVEHARLAGLLDEDDAAGKSTTGYDDGVPDADWSRPAVNDYAAKIGVVEPDKMKNKDLVLAAIKARLAKIEPPKTD